MSEPGTKVPLVRMLEDRNLQDRDLEAALEGLGLEKGASRVISFMLQPPVQAVRPHFSPISAETSFDLHEGEGQPSQL